MGSEFWEGYTNTHPIFYYGKIYIEFTILIIFKCIEQWMKYSHTIAQPPPRSISRTLEKLKL